MKPPQEFKSTEEKQTTVTSCGKCYNAVSPGGQENRGTSLNVRELKEAS